MPRASKTNLGVLLATTLLLVTGCAAATPDSTTTDPLAAAGFPDQTIHQVIDELEATPVDDRRDDLIASVRPNAVLFTVDGGPETSVPLEDEFYLSVAPYRNTTHDCYFHSLTTCVGELGDEPLHLTVVGDDGEVLLDEERTTNSNGFVGLWLPRDIDATLTITHENGSITTPISTGAEDPTCLTDLPLT